MDDKKKKRPAFLDKEDPEDAPEEEMVEDVEDEEDEEDVKKADEARLIDLLEAITKGLIETDVFVEDATATDFRDMLPHETLSSIEEVLKSARSAEPVGDPGMSEEPALSATELDELVEYVEKLEAENTEFRKSLEESLQPEETEISKALADLPVDVAKALEAERVELAKAREDLAKADIAKADGEYIAKMESLPGIVDSPESFGPVMRQIASMDADLAKAVEDVLTAANARITKGDLFKEVGNVAAPAGGDAIEKATAIAKSMMDANPELSLEEARGRVWETNPELYDEYASERREAAK